MSEPEISDRDLFGDAILPRPEGRGRPEHQWSLKNSNKVLLLFARGGSPKEAATAIGVSVPTLRKHYFSELAKREAAVLMMEATQLERLNTQAAAGNVAAEKELMKALQRGHLAALDAKVAKRQGPAKPKAVGKKEAAKVAAKAVGGKYAPPPAPTLLNPAGNA